MGLSGEHQVPPPKEEGEICFSSTCPVELGAQAGTAKLLSPCTQGPPWGTISSPSPNPAGVQREGRSEIRSPMEPLQGQDGRSRARRGPSEISIPWDPSPGPAGSMGCRRERQRIPKPSGARNPGRGKVPSRLLSPGAQVHGQLAARAAGVFGCATRVKVWRL